MVSQIDTATSFTLHLLILFVDSLLIIVLVWYLYSWAFIAFQWPLSPWHTMLQFLLAAVQSFTFSNIKQNDIWLIGLSVVALIGGVIRFINLLIVSTINYEKPEVVFKEDTDTDKKAAIFLFLIGIIIFSFGFWQHFYPNEKLETIGAFVILVVLLAMMLQADLSSKSIIDLHFAGTPWALIKRQLTLREQSITKKT